MNHMACIILNIDIHEFNSIVRHLDTHIEKLSARKNLYRNANNEYYELKFATKLTHFQYIKAIVENQDNLEGFKRHSITSNGYNAMLLELEREINGSCCMVDKHTKAEYEAQWEKRRHALSLAKLILKKNAPIGTDDYIPEGVLEPSIDEPKTLDK